ncbi:hypothetical protein [Sporomusa acidovorans]|uniref:Uncharacterized protein n=1 Tax=Sporomusa acidovorans (strain ATCC 49682 / DSM 3132 / Mol) TaxID=1123286 RepID=A0ABZ3IZC2_SPOA4|nr:hypothetical protein [Sporomusa acidovorans]OZC16337.1 hypothetical protein SPACI_43230 [Sporomusa acidovorans DSM 3132]SDF73475.1 hypothetical protein SAMN04488499_10747 [Sporomusa acidovorans]
MEFEYSTFTYSGYGCESVIISNGNYILFDEVNKTNTVLGRSPEEARQKLKEINMEHLSYLIP